VLVIGILTLASVQVLSNAWISTGLVILSYCARWRHGGLRSKADELQRSYEEAVGFDWPVDTWLLSDTLASAPKIVRKWYQRRRPDDAPYFLPTPTGPTRPVENVHESAWWTKHLAERMRTWVIWVLILALVLGVFMLSVVATSAGKRNDRQAVADTIVSVLVFLVTAGFVRLACDLSSTIRACERVQSRVHAVLAGEIGPIDALKLLHAYQSVRMQSPPILSILHRVYGSMLNDLWKETQGCSAKVGKGETS
jgi:hypothetical protein